VGGSSTTDRATGIAVDGSGNAYVTGLTASTETTFPVTVGPDLTYNGSNDGFVAKVNAAGTALVYCGYVGGSGVDACQGIDVDAAGNAYLAGMTNSAEATFPVKVGPDLTYNGPTTAPYPPGPYGDAFVAKVNTGGTALVYCGYVGGSGSETANDVAVDATGSACITGTTCSTEATFPVRDGPDLTYNGPNYNPPRVEGDAFLARIHPTGTVVVCCGYIGGILDDEGIALQVSASGDLFVAGHTSTSTVSNFPVRVGPDLTPNGGPDGFVAKVSFTLLDGAGTPRPGGIVNLAGLASGDAGLAWQMGSSFGTGPLNIDQRQLHLSADLLLTITVADMWPSIFSGYRGIVDLSGRVPASIHIPNAPVLIGLRIHSAFVTLNPAAPSGIQSISNTFSFSITK